MISDSNGGLDVKQLEQIAAYLDDALGREERAEVESLLARSEAAREVLAESVRLREDVGIGHEGAGAAPPVVPSASSRPHWRIWAPIAAAAVLAAVVLVSQLARAPRSAGETVRVALDAAALSGQGDWTRQGWSVYRGAVPVDDVAFRVGVRWTDLLMAWERGDVQRSDELVGEIRGLLGDVGLTGGALEELALADSLAVASTRFEAVAGDLRRAERALASSLASERFEPGVWIEAARLAALSGQPGFFADPGVERALRELAGREWPPDVRRHLETLASNDDGAALPGLAAAADSLVLLLGG